MSTVTTQERTQFAKKVLAKMELTKEPITLELLTKVYSKMEEKTKFGHQVPVWLIHAMGLPLGNKKLRAPFAIPPLRVTARKEQTPAPTAPVVAKTTDRDHYSMEFKIKLANEVADLIVKEFNGVINLQNLQSALWIVSLANGKQLSIVPQYMRVAFGLRESSPKTKPHEIPPIDLSRFKKPTEVEQKKTVNVQETPVVPVATEYSDTKGTKLTLPVAPLAQPEELTRLEQLEKQLLTLGNLPAAVRNAIDEIGSIRQSFAELKTSVDKDMTSLFELMDEVQKNGNTDPQKIQVTVPLSTTEQEVAKVTDIAKLVDKTVLPRVYVYGANTAEFRASMTEVLFRGLMTSELFDVKVILVSDDNRTITPEQVNWADINILMRSRLTSNMEKVVASRGKNLKIINAGGTALKLAFRELLAQEIGVIPL